MTSQRRFDALRARPAQSVASQEEPIGSVIRRHLIANADGQRILSWMLDEAGKVTPLNCPESTLREAEGARRFVETLLREGSAG